MKLNKSILAVGLLAALTLPSYSAVTISTQFGVALDKNSAAVPDGTLWALVVDNGDNVLPGGLALNSSIKAASALAGGLDLINATFGGASLALGTSLGGDTVFALGGFNGGATLGVGGSTADAVILTLGANGLASGRNYAFYYFPGTLFTTEGATYSGFTQVGGVNTNTADAGALTDGMIIPNDGFTVTQGASTPGDLGGSFSQSGFTSVELIPEPSAALLGAIGVLGLLRRRRA